MPLNASKFPYALNSFSISFKNMVPSATWLRQTFQALKNRRIGDASFETLNPCYGSKDLKAPHMNCGSANYATKKGAPANLLLNTLTESTEAIINTCPF